MPQEKAQQHCWSFAFGALVECDRYLKRIRELEAKLTPEKRDRPR